jgi:hypothetical protein
MPVQIVKYNLVKELTSIRDFFYKMYLESPNRFDIEDQCFDLGTAIMVAECYEQDFDHIKNKLGLEKYKELMSEE